MQKRTFLLSEPRQPGWTTDRGSGEDPKVMGYAQREESI